MSQLIQKGLFDMQDRYEQLSQGGDPLVKLNEIIVWESFRKILNKALRKDRKSNAGRPPYDYVMMFKVLVLQSLYNLSDHQVEFQIRDRLSFMRFLDLSISHAIPDEKTVWEFREKLIQTRVLDKLFRRFNMVLANKGYGAQCGSIVDASIVDAPVQRNSRNENKEIKEGKTPDSFKENVHKLKQKDVDARWTRKRGQNYYGYKNHINIDTKHKLIRKYNITPANECDGNILPKLLDKTNDNNRLWADSLYRTKTTEKLLKENNILDRMHYRSHVKGGWLPEDEVRENRRRTKIRKRVEHIFGYMENSMGGKFIRTIGIKRARWKIGMMNLVYNMCRLEQLQRLGVA